MASTGRVIDAQHASCLADTFTSMDSNDRVEYRFPDSESGRVVFRVGDPASSRPVVLLHELGGLSQPTLDYADKLVAARCVVHLPLIFGSIGQQSASRGFAQVCWGRQLTLWLSNRRSKLADWVGRFCDHIRDESGHSAVVMGMCATGGVVFSVLMNDSVGGGVAAQPSLPFRHPWSVHNTGTLGATAEEVEASAESGKPFAALRYQRDWICPAGRIVQMAETFGNENVVEVSGKGHSTLVYEYHDQAHQRVLELLDQVFDSTE